jgi:hypothetical protein
LEYWHRENGASCRELLNGTTNAAKSWEPCSCEVMRSKCSEWMIRLPFFAFREHPGIERNLSVAGQ